MDSGAPGAEAAGVAGVAWSVQSSLRPPYSLREQAGGERKPD